MRQLSWHDTRYLYTESNPSNTNVTLIQIYDQSTAPGGMVRFKSIMTHIEGRLDSSPIFRSRLMRVPFELDNPYWVEDENFDIEHHVRHIALPKPGDWRQFCIQASRLHARSFDLNRPLWEVYVVEGLDSIVDLPVGSFAVLIKIHHAAIDIENVNQLSILLHNLSSDPPKAEPLNPWFPEPSPGKFRLLCRGALKSFFTPLQMGNPLTRALVKIIPPAMNFIKDMTFKQETMTATRFSSVVSPYRVFDSRRFRLDEFRAISRLVPGATVNDVILAVCAGTLRRYLSKHDELPITSLSVVAPVFVREKSASADSQPKVSWMRGDLGTDIGDPVDRLKFIQQQNAKSKVIARAVRAKGLTDVSVHDPATTLALASKILAKAATDISNRMPIANCIVTNVPGSSEPVYLNGARMTYFSAIMPLHDGMGLVFAVTSYDGRIIISPTSCRYLMPDPDVFSQCIRDSFQEYLALAMPTKPLRPARPSKASVSALPKPAGRRGSTSDRRGPPRRSA